MPLIRRSPEPNSSGGGQDLRAALSSEDAQARWGAARAATAADLPLLGEALRRESDGRVREAIFTALARIGGDSLDIVLPYLHSDDAALRTQALDVLLALPQAVRPRLAEILVDSDADARVLACELARDLPQSEAEALLVALIEREAEVNVCAAAVEVLSDVGGPGAVPALERCAARFASEPFLRFATAVAIERLSGAPGG